MHFHQSLVWLNLDNNAPTLTGPPRLNPESGPPSCTTPRQLTMYNFKVFASRGELCTFIVTFSLFRVKLTL